VGWNEDDFKLWCFHYPILSIYSYVKTRIGKEKEMPSKEENKPRERVKLELPMLGILEKD